MRTIIRTSLLGLVLLTVAAPPGPAAAQGGDGPALEFLNPDGARGNRPFSEAVRVGDILYLSGKIGTVPGRGLAEGGVQAETRAALDAIKAALERYGSSMERVFKCLVILTDMADFGAMNEVYTSYFPGDKPARSAFAASGLAAGARVEIECVAAVGEGRGGRTGAGGAR
ncbi:MAG TPA: RidA family protein [Longimicrobiales bacterium]|nr:RidA family protein [Longimicrobiales bacterium]